MYSFSKTVAKHSCIGHDRSQNYSEKICVSTFVIRILESNKGTDLSKNNDDLDTSIWFEYGMSTTKGHNSFNQN